MHDVSCTNFIYVFDEDEVLIVKRLLMSRYIIIKYLEVNDVKYFDIEW